MGNPLVVSQIQHSFFTVIFLGLLFGLSVAQDTFCQCEKFPIDGKPFVALWNAPTGGCEKNFSIKIELDDFKIRANPLQTWNGKYVVVFYNAQLGFYPYYTNAAGTRSYNGGMPQIIDINAHLEKSTRDIVWRIPDPNFHGLAVIDWEGWRPTWQRNWDSKKIYQTRSIEMMRAQYPDWPMERLVERARKQFEDSARMMMEETLKLGKHLRPKAKWGFYGFPDCYGNENSDYMCSDEIDLRDTIGQAANFGAAGIVMWGNRRDENTSPDICRQINSYVHNKLGPYFKSTELESEKCSKEKCNGNGRCIKRTLAQEFNIYGDELETCPGKRKVKLQENQEISDTRTKKLQNKYEQGKDVVEVSQTGKAKIINVNKFKNKLKGLKKTFANMDTSTSLQKQKNAAKNKETITGIPKYKSTKGKTTGNEEDKNIKNKYKSNNFMKNFVKIVKTDRIPFLDVDEDDYNNTMGANNRVISKTTCKVSMNDPLLLPEEQILQTNPLPKSLAMRLSYYLCGRPTAKVLIACVLSSVVTLYFAWSNCRIPKVPLSTLPREDTGDLSNPDPQIYCADLVSTALREREDQEYADRKEREEKIRDNCPKSIPYESIDVIVNGGDKRIEGRIDSDSNEPYVPFSFVKNYFEIYGDVQKLDKKRVLQWKHSYSEIHESKLPYDPKGPFLWFQGYHVEGRQRVICISGKEEVPVSSQWNPKGHYYPIQIAQYGLSHYSMLQVERKSHGRSRVFEDAETSRADSDLNWIANAPNDVQNVYDVDRATRVIKFNTPDFGGEGVALHLDSSTKEYVLSFDLKVLGTGRVTVTMETNNAKQHVLHYSSDDKLIEVNGKEIFMGLGIRDGWRKITRNLDTDLRKGLKVADAKSRKEKSSTKIIVTEIQSIVLHGNGMIDNITLSRTARVDFFLAAADWFVRHQDDKGGWPSTVKRKILEGIEIKPGWYSAMAQGQAMSLLTRAYYFTKNNIYLNAALKATSVFKIPSENNGVRATFMDKYHWYEEYPTTPSLYVLNGFVYSLLGLHDLTLAAPANQKHEAEELFQDGMKSLKMMLLMFDAGSGTFYDLRHISMRAPPNLARWDYHTLHVSLLMFLSGIDNDPIFKATSLRWTGYTKGKKAKHN
ncbi:hypothetical protein QZH41_010904 [Actinostola sp. cb2023]|nr:hypothetical protein QZH41_010904 [Actinostola sp. cb2023]